MNALLALTVAISNGESPSNMLSSVASTLVGIHDIAITATAISRRAMQQGCGVCRGEEGRRRILAVERAEAGVVEESTGLVTGSRWLPPVPAAD